MRGSFPSSEIILYQTEGARKRIGVRLENETVCMTQELLVELLQTAPQNSNLHIHSIYAEGETRPEAIYKHFLLVRREGRIAA